MENVLKLMLFFFGSAGAFFAMDKLLGLLGVTSIKIRNACALGGVVLLIVAFGIIFGFEGGYQAPDWSERARR